ANTDALRGVAWFAGWTRLIGNITQTVIIVVGAWLVIEGWTQIGVLAAFILYLRRFYGPLDELVQAFNLYQSASAALEKIAAVLDTDPEVVEPERPRSLPTRGKETAEAGSTGAGPQPGSGRTLDLDAVRFAYADGPDVLPRFDLHIPAGQIVALVGATGAASRRWSSPSPASTIRALAGSASTRWTCVISTMGSCAHPSSWSPRSRSSSPAPSPTTSASATRMPETRTSSPQPARWASTPTSADCRTATPRM